MAVVNRPQWSWRNKGTCNTNHAFSLDRPSPTVTAAKTRSLAFNFAFNTSAIVKRKSFSLSLWQLPGLGDKRISPVSAQPCDATFTKETEFILLHTSSFEAFSLVRGSICSIFPIIFTSSSALGSCFNFLPLTRKVSTHGLPTSSAPDALWRSEEHSARQP